MRIDEAERADVILLRPTTARQAPDDGPRRVPSLSDTTSSEPASATPKPRCAVPRHYGMFTTTGSSSYR